MLFILEKGLTTKRTDIEAFSLRRFELLKRFFFFVFYFSIVFFWGGCGK